MNYSKFIKGNGCVSFFFVLTFVFRKYRHLSELRWLLKVESYLLAVQIMTFLNLDLL